MLKWTDGWDWISPCGMRYRAPYGANNIGGHLSNSSHQQSVNKVVKARMINFKTQLTPALRLANNEPDKCCVTSCSLVIVLAGPKQSYRN